jgi:hypothetical protein
LVAERLEGPPPNVVDGLLEERYRLSSTPIVHEMTAGGTTSISVCGQDGTATII